MQNFPALLFRRYGNLKGVFQVNFYYLCNHSAVICHLQALEKIQKLGKGILHEIMKRNISCLNCLLSLSLQQNRKIRNHF